MKREKWKSIPGYERIYDVSDRGNIRSRHQNGRFFDEYPGKTRPISLWTDRRFGYKRVYLYGKWPPKVHAVHRLVLEAFIGPCPSKLMECHHIDGNPSNNHLENLVWSDRSHRGDKKGKSKPNKMRKLSSDQVREIRELSCRGISSYRIAPQFNICETACRYIIKRKTYKDVIKLNLLQSSPLHPQVKRHISRSNCFDIKLIN